MTAPILTATTPDGTVLPVIDITHPAFAAPVAAAEIEFLRAAALSEESRRGPLQRFLLGFLLRRLARNSRLIGALQAAREGFLGGIPTYVMKLGPDNLMAPYNSEIDRRLVMSPTVTSMRTRLHQVATLLADGLAPRLKAAPGAPLGLLEIAGGPSADGLNALILLERQGLLAGRPVQIVIYDIDTTGPAFAAAMLAALQTGPLAGRDITLAHVSDNWSDRAALGRVVAGFPAGAILAATSEGGLFEYGTDADIAGVLETLAPAVPIVTGSVTRDDELNRLMRLHSHAPTVSRGLDRFAQLIAPAGYRIELALPNVLADQVLLTTS